MFRFVVYLVHLVRMCLTERVTSEASRFTGSFLVYTQWPISIYNPKYLLKYFTYEKMVPTKVPTFFLNEKAYFWLRLWKEREISHQKWPEEKWFLWPWKGKNLRSNVWETTRCPFSELSWFFGINKQTNHREVILSTLSLL